MNLNVGSDVGGKKSFRMDHQYYAEFVDSLLSAETRAILEDTIVGHGFYEFCEMDILY